MAKYTKKELIEIAKGPLGNQLSKYPLLFSISVNIIENPNDFKKSEFFNGTGSLIKLKNTYIGITCDHVLRKYDKIINAGKECLFAFGNLQIDPYKSLIDRSKKFDIAIFSLEGYELNKIQYEKNIGSEFINPSSWPPTKIKKNDLVILGGFPKIFRKEVSPFYFSMASLSIGPIPVTHTFESRVTCQFDREYWVYNKRNIDFDTTRTDDLGGLSGSPVFKYDQTSIDTFEFIGIVYEYKEMPFDILNIRHAEIINLDCTINSSFF